jgi:hypothetical protein
MAASLPPLSGAEIERALAERRGMVACGMIDDDDLTLAALSDLQTARGLLLWASEHLTDEGRKSSEEAEIDRFLGVK